ncbi:MAG: L-seryl-tRNA(Sec) selenium transferase [Planctomycetes bacterium]|nr:L-seryl-tRNA(Sec) selenium transferase [Planctomycetota bacterium]
MPTSEPSPSAVLRGLPSIEALLRQPHLAAWPRPLLADVARAWLDELRAAVLAGQLDAAALAARLGAPAHAELVLRCQRRAAMRHRSVVNATGIVLHTGLGRAPLAAAAVAAVQQAAQYAIVELDPDTGVRDQRELGVAALLRDLTGAAALVVNNNAAATLLMLAAHGAGREVVVSRGELVEIGGGFRMPDVMQQAGCRLVEVGTTNRTRVGDFEAATGPHTAAWLCVHPSNFRIEGFTAAPELPALVAAARARGLPVLDDLGSGLLWDAPLPGLETEPRVRAHLAAGPAVVVCSGDKLLGGPQCGILFGSAEAIAQCRRHPLYRALRCDKLTLAALEATLRIYRDSEPLVQIPTLAMLAAPPARLEARSRELAQRLGGAARVVPRESFAGSGANPARPLPSFAVALPCGDALATALRRSTPRPIFARVHQGAVQLDARTLLHEDLEPLAAAVRSALASP